MMSTLFAFPMLFISTAFYSLDHAPRWIQAISKLNPVEYASLIGKNAMNGVVDVQSSVVLVLLAIASAIVAVRTFRYE